MNAAIVIGLFAIFAAGLAILLMGLRGRRINDHPICRGCGFDLMGVLPGGTTCPECGAGVKSSRWVRIGARKKRVTWVIAGAVLSAGAFVPIGVLGWSCAAGADLNPHKPTALLIWESLHASPKLLGPVLNELSARWTAGTLSSNHKRQIVSLALTNQGDLTRPWNEVWGDLYENAKFEQIPTEEEQLQFESHSAVPALRVPPEAKPGQRIRFYLTTAESRQSTRGSAHLKAFVLSATMNGVQLDRAPESGKSERHPLFGVATLSPRGSARKGGFVDQPASELLTIPAGASPGDAEIVIELGVRAYRGSWDTKVEANQQRVSVRAPIKILAADAAPVGVVPVDGTSRPLIEEFLRSVTWTSERDTTKKPDGSFAWSTLLGYGLPPDGLVSKGGTALFADLYLVSADGQRLLFAEVTTRFDPEQTNPRLDVQAAPGSSPLWQQQLPDPLKLIAVLRPERAREMDPPALGYGGDEIIIDNATVERKQ